MTISTASNKSVVQGNGLTNSFAYSFLVPDASQMFVYYTDTSGNSVLLNNTQYSISGIGNPNGGTVTYPLSGSPISTGASLTMIRILAYQQLTDLINQGGYYPEVVEAALDYLTMLAQQLTEAQNRALSLAVESDGSISVILPVPQANYLIGWNSGANGLTNISPASLSGLVSYGNWSSASFSGDGTTTDFTLSSDPLAAANIDVSVGAAVQRAGIDYTYIGANTVRFSTAPPVGTNNVFMRWGSALPLGVATSVSGQTTFGTSLIQAVNAAAAIAILGAVDTSSAQTIGGQKTFSVRPIMPTATPGTNDTGGANTAFVVASATDVRQTVRQGAINSGGYANMLSAGSGLTLNLAATAVPMITSFAQGIVNSMAVLSSDVTGVVSALAARNLSFITQDYVSPTAVTWGKTLAPPQYGYAYNQAAQSLLHFDGSAGATSFIDDFGNSWSAISGARLQTNQIKIGTAALGGSGTNNALNGSSDYIQCNAFQSLGNGGWSMRAWVYLQSLPASGNTPPIITAIGAGGYGASLTVYSVGGTIKFGCNLSSNGSSSDIASNLLGTTTPATNTWYFVELTYDAVAGVYRLYVNGTQEATVASAAKICSISRIQVGGGVVNGNLYYLNGYIDEFEFLPYCDHPGGTAYSAPTVASSVATQGYCSDFFSIGDMTMYQVTGASSAAGSNPSMIVKKRLYVGECITGASSVSSVVNYAMNGRYHSGRFAVGSNTAYNKAHNIGVEPNNVAIYGAGVSGGPLNQFRNVVSGTSDYGAYIAGVDRKNATLATQTSPQLMGGAASVLTAVEAVLTCSRGW